LTLLFSQVFASEALADDLSLPQIGSVEIISKNVDETTNASNTLIINSNTLGSVKITNNQFKGDSVSTQISLLNMQLDAQLSTNNDNINDESYTPLFALASRYHFTDSTQMALRYNNGLTDELNPIPLNIRGSKTSRTDIVELAVQHKFNNDLALIANANWKNWDSDENYDNASYNNIKDGSYNDTFGAGTAISYQLDSWTLQTGVSIDTNPFNNNNISSSLLGIDEQWRLGFGGIKKLNANMSLGMSYQYQSLGSTKVSEEGMPTYSDDNIHFITTTLSF
jgi:long-chain fatty acid transport protein